MEINPDGVENIWGFGIEGFSSFEIKAESFDKSRILFRPNSKMTFSRNGSNPKPFKTTKSADISLFRSPGVSE